MWPSTVAKPVLQWFWMQNESLKQTSANAICCTIFLTVKLQTDCGNLPHAAPRSVAKLKSPHALVCNYSSRGLCQTRAFMTHKEHALGIVQPPQNQLNREQGSMWQRRGHSSGVVVGGGGARIPGQVFVVLSSPNNCKHGEDAGDLMRQMSSNSYSPTRKKLLLFQCSPFM